MPCAFSCTQRCELQPSAAMQWEPPRTPNYEDRDFATPLYKVGVSSVPPEWKKVQKFITCKKLGRKRPYLGLCLPSLPLCSGVFGSCDEWPPCALLPPQGRFGLDDPAAMSRCETGASLNDEALVASVPFSHRSMRAGRWREATAVTQRH